MHKFSGTSPACSTVYARAGVLGNPADLFGGETIALTFSNFKTIVTLESNTQCILEIDGSITKFSNLLDLEEALRDTQKQLAINLLGASLNRFIRIMGGAKHLLSRGDYSNFHLHFDSNIPRQAGLSGSSAIIIGTLRSLCRFYDVDMTRHQISELALDIETKDLGITAGPMDRVIQTYGGSRHLIFSTERKTLSSIEFEFGCHLTP